MDTYTFWLDINVIILKFSKQSYTHTPSPATLYCQCHMKCLSVEENNEAFIKGN